MPGNTVDEGVAAPNDEQVNKPNPLVTVPLLVILALSGCSQEPASPPSAEPTESDTTSGPVTPVGDPSVVVTDLESPWSVVRLESGSALISERNTGTVKELSDDGEVRVVGTVPDVVHEGESGLLGLAVLDEEWLYAYLTTATDNRIVRFELLGGAGDYSLGAKEDVLTGLVKERFHDGGRIAFGPDGMLYATVGDASNLALSQDVTSYNGKILRMTETGGVPEDNPFENSLVYSLGHRNPQGIAWDDSGQLYAAEFGQDTWDEFNRIEAGGNYGWPIIEGIGDDPDYIDPLYQWNTAEASPSGLTYIRGTFFMAGLGGHRVWAIYPDGASEPTEWYKTTKYGRVRDVLPGPDGSLWFLTNNTDGRGEPSEGDDKIWQVELDVLSEG